MDPLYTRTKVCHDPPRRFVSAHARLCAPKVFTRLVFFFVFLGSYNYSQPPPWTDFDAKYAKKRGCARMCLFGVANIKSN